MKIRLLLLPFLSILVILTMYCQIPINQECDLKLVTSNLLFENEQMDEAVTSLIELNADVYLLHEVDFSNIPEEKFIDAGYSCYESTDSTHQGFNGVIASKIGGGYSDIALRYELGYFDVSYTEPYYGIRLLIKGQNIALIGAHVPPAIGFMTDEIEVLRKKSIQDISSFVARGEITAAASEIPLFQSGDKVIIAGDFNSFPNDSILNPLLNAGLDDAILVNNNPVDFTWRPASALPFTARIDYTFVSQKLEMLYQYSIEVPGSDHKAIITGINVP